ncbi:MAG: hypothetical protein LBV42_04840 [Methanobrevibacter sp.]|jgi:hypothetical protein|nr:hypothetical protein [Methanobrevibacter sp.]
MRFFKFFGLIIIVLIISTTFIGSCISAVKNEDLGNNESGNNSTDNIPILNNTINSINNNTPPTGPVSLPVYNICNGMGSLNIKHQFMARPVWGECGVWKPFMN